MSNREKDVHPAAALSDIVPGANGWGIEVDVHWVEV